MSGRRLWGQEVAKLKSLARVPWPIEDQRFHDVTPIAKLSL
jgi:hypothetical protein